MLLSQWLFQEEHGTIVWSTQSFVDVASAISSRYKTQQSKLVNHITLEAVIGKTEAGQLLASRCSWHQLYHVCSSILLSL